MVKRYSRKRRQRGGRGKKGFSHPKKGRRSRTRKGNKNFTTKRGNKNYHRKRHNIVLKKRPYTKRRRRRRGGRGILGYSHPTKGQASRTRRGNKNFTTKRGNQNYHRNRHNVVLNTKPFQKGGCGQCISEGQIFRSHPDTFQGPASMTGEAAKGSNYYAKLQKPSLPDPKSTTAPMKVQKGGGWMYNYGLGGLQKGWWDLTNAGKNLYHQWNGAKPVASASSMSQPIDHKVKIISYDPPDVSAAYDKGAHDAAQYTLQNM